MDSDGFDSFRSTRFGRLVQESFPSSSSRRSSELGPHYAKTDLSLANSHGMPWQTSIDPSYSFPYQHKGDICKPFYMPFWEYQMEFLQSHLSGLQPLPVVSSNGNDMSFMATDSVRVHTCAFTSQENERIRLTMLDAGNKTQVFTSLFYPRANVPVFGVDLLQFHKKHLCVIDFQPIHATEDDHSCSYEDILYNIRQQYPQLQKKMTKRCYDESQFFSSNMMLGRQEGELGHDMVWNQVFPAYKQALRAHLVLSRKALSVDVDRERARLGRMAYDTYSAARDPAHAMFVRPFGKAWADDYVYDVLFPHAKR
jgi:hypothetical protein